MLIFDETRLLLSIESFPNWKRIAFMAYCCERMLPNYFHFYNQTNFGDPEVLRKSLDQIWVWIESDEIPENLEEVISACDRQAPNTEDFDSIYTSSALDSASAISITLESLRDPTASQVIEVASLSRDTVYMFIEWLDGRGDSLKNAIIKNDLMQAELLAQKTSLEILKNLKNDRTEAMSLRLSWSNLNKGSVDLA